MSLSTSTALSRGDVRTVLALVAETARSRGDAISRSHYLLSQLVTLTGSAAGLSIRIRRKRGRPVEMQAIVERAEPTEDLMPAMLADVRNAPNLAVSSSHAGGQVSRSNSMQFFYPLRGTGNYACLVLHRRPDARGYSAREHQIAEQVWQTLGCLHKSPLRDRRVQAPSET